jgi:hypothetical protein
MFKLAIKDTVQVKVKFTIKDKGVDRLFAFTLDCTRLAQDVVSERLSDKDKTVMDFMRDLITGWDTSQRLVLLPDDTPAPWSPEAVDAMLDVSGVGHVIFTAYLKDVGATTKN